MRKPLLIFLLAAGILLEGCGREKILGSWEFDVEKTLAQYEKVPPRWSSLAEFQENFRREYTGRRYKFTGSRPLKPEWGVSATNFQGSIKSRREGKMRFYGAWQVSSNQPGTYDIFVYTVNSGTSYMPAGKIRLGTNQSQLLWYTTPDEKPRVLRRT